ncbi:Tcoingi protein, partial [Trypanosoma conorhini]
MDQAGSFFASIYAPRPISTPVFVAQDHPLTKTQHANALATLYRDKSTRATGAPVMVLPPVPQADYPPLTRGELLQAISELNNGTAPGEDNIYCEELKEMGRVGHAMLLRLFNRSLRSGKVPKQWRRGIIIPLLKPNKPASDLSSFRPVTLTSTLCKLMERMIARRLRDAVEHKLQPQQSGFRQQHSTLDTLAMVIAALRRDDPEERTAAVFIDYARAFDSVDHGCIMQALQSFGISPVLQRWIGSFLGGRTARVRVNNTYSRDVKLTCGVPQGSVLGPLLFIIAIDSLSVRLNAIPNLAHGFFA